MISKVVNSVDPSPGNEIFEKKVELNSLYKYQVKNNIEMHAGKNVFTTEAQFGTNLMCYIISW